MPSHMVGDGEVSMQAKAIREVCGKQGEETAATSMAAKWFSRLAIGPDSSVLQWPYRPRSTQICVPCDLWSFEPQQGGHVSEDALPTALTSSWRMGEQGGAYAKKCPRSGGTLVPR